MSTRFDYPTTGGRVASVIFTERTDGDLAIDAPPDELDRRRRIVSDRRWVAAIQVHGSDVLGVDGQASTLAGRCDALITASPEVAISVQVADCAPVALVGSGAVSVVHAGWRGLEAGVLANAAAILANRGAITGAVLGPCVHPECYEFGPAELDRLRDRFGSDIVGSTENGRPALDLPAAVRAELRELGIDLLDVVDVCTACTPGRYWSHRARSDTERQSLVAWIGDGS